MEKEGGKTPGKKTLGATRCTGARKSGSPNVEDDSISFLEEWFDEKGMGKQETTKRM